MIYTSRYQNRELNSGGYAVFGVTLGAPKFKLGYELRGNIMEIAPPGRLFHVYDKERFTKEYKRNLDRIGAGRIKKILDSCMSPGKDIVLCCYEDVRKPGEWCHRQVFAEWWLEKTGEGIAELPDPSDPGAGAKAGKAERDKAKPAGADGEYEQLDLFGGADAPEQPKSAKDLYYELYS